MDAERGLCLVGITRDKKRLYLLRSYRRSLFGGSTANLPSRFLQDISPRLISSKGLWDESLTHASPSNSYWHSEPSAFSSSAPLLRVGDHVRHSRFGAGIVMNCNPTRDDQELTVAFEEAGVKKLLASLAPLQKIEEDMDFPS
jgi:DNA helicase-2/ATP-dependent DNA helicase PcrA